MLLREMGQMVGTNNLLTRGDLKLSRFCWEKPSSKTSLACILLSKCHDRSFPSMKGQKATSSIPIVVSLSIIFLPSIDFSPYSSHSPPLTLSPSHSPHHFLSCFRNMPWKTPRPESDSPLAISYAAFSIARRQVCESHLSCVISWLWDMERLNNVIALEFRAAR